MEIVTNCYFKKRWVGINTIITRFSKIFLIRKYIEVKAELGSICANFYGVTSNKKIVHEDLSFIILFSQSSTLFLENEHLH